MATFEIYFFGLICHLGDVPTEKYAAAVVRADGHRRYVTISGVPTDLSEDVVRIQFGFGGRISTGRAATDRHFAEYVPSLKSLMGGTLVRDSVMPQRAVLVDYPQSQDERGEERRGELSVADLYDHQATYFGGGRILRPRGCVARLTKLTVTRPSDATMTIYTVTAAGPQEIGSVQDGGCVLIANESRTQLTRPKRKSRRDHARDPKRETAAEHEHDEPGTHARHYANIVDESNPIVDVEEKEKRCDWEDAPRGWLNAVSRSYATPTSTYAECGNTSWP